MGSGSSSPKPSPTEPVRMSIDETGNVTFSPLSVKSKANAYSGDASTESSVPIKQPEIEIAAKVTTPGVDAAKSEIDTEVPQLVSPDIYDDTKPVVANLNIHDDDLKPTSKLITANDSLLSPARKRLTLAPGIDAFKPFEENLLKCYAEHRSQPLRCSEQAREYRDFVAKHRKNLMSTMALIAIIFTIMVLHVGSVQSVGSMSVDLGSEWMKVGLVAPSVPMDIVLNSQSQRKTPMAVSFHNGERYLGDAAADIATKYPEKTFTHFLDLVAKPIDHESVILYRQRFPYISITQHPNVTDAVLLNHPEGMSFTPLELTAMMLQHAYDQVLARLNDLEPVNDAVLTVPAYFNLSERNAIQEAARLIGLNVLQLINSNSAFALSYGIFRHNNYQLNKTSIMFYDQGASSSSVTIADYYLTELLTPEGEKKNETLPTVDIRAVAYDRYLGGFEMQLRLRDYLAKAFGKQSGINVEKILSRGKSAAKLLKEAGRVKKVLSANADYVVRVENVMDDKDLRLPMTRQEYEDLCDDLLTTRTTKVIEDLLATVEDLKMDNIEKVIIVGGNTRTPRVQKVIQDHLKLEQLGKQINADEGAALAALYQAASMARGFRVKRFLFHELGEAPTTNIDGVSVNTTEQTESLDGNTIADVQNDATIFSLQDLERMRLKLMDLKEQDAMRLQRLSLKNSLESLIGEVRNRLDYDESLKPRADEIQKVVDETAAWFDAAGHETDDVTILVQKLNLLRVAVFPPPPPPPPPTTPAPVVLNETDQIVGNETIQTSNDAANTLESTTTTNIRLDESQNGTNSVSSQQFDSNQTSQSNIDPSKPTQSETAHTEL